MSSIAMGVKCDDCGDEMLVNRDDFEHPNCVLALCDLCIPRPYEKDDVGMDDRTPHHVIGTNKKHFWYELHF